VYSAIRWQTIIALLGIILLGVYLSSIVVVRTTTVVPERGGTYVEGVAGTPQFINPLLAQYSPLDQDLASLIFDGLTRADGLGGIEPDLATSWSVSNDGLAYVFQLRNDVQWSDGHRFDADDVRFTIRLMQDPDFPGPPYLRDLWSTVRVEKIDDETLRFVLAEPFPPFLDYTTIGIVPEHILADVTAGDLLSAPFNLAPIGTGPFRLEEISSQRAVLKPNRRHWDDISFINHLEFRFYPDQPSVYAAHKAREIDGIGAVSAVDVSLVEEQSDLTIYTARLSAYTILYFNLQDRENLPFFQNVRVRQALHLGLDRQALIDEALNGRGLVAESPVLAWSWAFNPNLATTLPDRERAAQLLAAAGWVDSDGDGWLDKNDRRLVFTLLVNERPDLVRVAEAVARQWQTLGVEASVEPMGAGLGERLSTRQYQAALVEIQIAGDPDPYPFWHETQIDSGQNYAGWSHRAASETLEQARATTDRGRRTELYYRFQEIFATEVPSLILYNPVYTYAVDRNVRGVQLSPLVRPADRFRNVGAWYTLTRRVIVSEAAMNPLLSIPTVQP
jgi:peptide/nickel transport system substrate-binding protein